MKLSLLQGRYNPVIISFILLSSLIGKPLLASPGGQEHHPVRNHAQAPGTGTIDHWRWTKITVTATATNSGVLTCTHPSTTITASTSASGTTTYSWTGPNGFTATGASVTVSTAGTYTVTGTNSGKTGSASVTVTSNTAAPPSMEPGNTGPLTCSNPSSTLVMPFGSATGITVSWAGPNGFTSTDAFPAVSVPGTYYLVVTYTATGCSTLNPTIVVQDINAPAVSIASNTGATLLTCTNPSIILTASSTTTSGISFNWAGPNSPTSSAASINATSPGTYQVTATNSSNGCTSTSSTIVTQDTARPTAVTIRSIPDNAQLTCSNANVVLFASSQTAKALFSWTGPNGFSSTLQATPVSVAGNYTVTITNSSNGCSVSMTAPTVTQNTTVPEAVSVSVSDKLTCNHTRVKLSGSSTTAGVTYAWIGPNGFTASDSVTNVTAGGVYTLTATDPTNGCSFSRPITVQADQVHPTGVTISSDGSLSCTVGSVTLTGGSTTPNVGYTWSGPNGFFDPEQITSVVDSGTYLLTVNNPVNGCNTTATITVTADFTECSAINRKAINGHAATLDVSDGSAAVISGLTCKVYPNPASGSAYVNLNAPQKGHVSVEVYNGAGVREKILFDGNVEAGTAYQWVLDASRLPAGIHYCIVRTNHKVYTSKLLIAAGRP
ncbi:T9SS type A sorting domain-containing protein [Flavitalea sp. BT771]|uniref:T9SS type A sorting domain-containing protein n=1 Tax=Flavitalea sp. BT771 TaxID=3063329 RepID=UPI0026E410E4|nr:T9SS type A sorting domain-containing protein [Flavitalea sp. BT771]MDO6429446.1 T9SS type A sorting domain-containing protein [Flavitalea sp. BT771]MDV6218426.1 T9SS type A sorting domain-containing protein [Flavitalea sp. BT771]